jgi:hypothetical protein
LLLSIVEVDSHNTTYLPKEGSSMSPYRQSDEVPHLKERIRELEAQLNPPKPKREERDWDDLTDPETPGYLSILFVVLVVFGFIGAMIGVGSLINYLATTYVGMSKSTANNFTTISILFLMGIACAIPVYRWKKGY